MTQEFLRLDLDDDSIELGWIDAHIEEVEAVLDRLEGERQAHAQADLVVLKRIRARLVERIMRKERE